MTNTLFIFLGAGIGGVLRYWVSNIVYLMVSRQFPYGTLVVNITGCFFMGILFVLLLERFDGMGSPLRSFLLIGLLGGYTTFSSFSIETLNLFESGDWLGGFFNIFFSVTLCMIAAWLGMVGGRHL